MAVTITNSVLRDYVVACNQPRPADGVLHLASFRGCRRYPADGVVLSLVESIPNSYDDQLLAFGADLCSYSGTCDPGLYYTQHPMRPKEGCAHLVGIDEPGGKPYAYKRGMHRGKAPAFVQDGPVVVWRDKDRSGSQSPAEAPRSESAVGLNIHRMGTIRSDVGRWSAGCLGVMDKWWSEYWKRTALAHPQERYTLYLMDFALFAKWFDA